MQRELLCLATPEGVENAVTPVVAQVIAVSTAAPGNFLADACTI